jgi:hypothetical protein
MHEDSGAEDPIKRLVPYRGKTRKAVLGKPPLQFRVAPQGLFDQARGGFDPEGLPSTF